jgi:lysophospholipase L1-like esterase
VVFSPVPRNLWKDGNIDRSTNEYPQWAAQVAKAEGAHFVDLHEIVAGRYETLGPERVKADFFPGDHTHTNRAGAQLNAALVTEGLKALKKSPVQQYLLRKD